MLYKYIFLNELYYIFGTINKDQGKSFFQVNSIFLSITIIKNLNNA